MVLFRVLIERSQHQNSQQEHQQVVHQWIRKFAPNAAQQLSKKVGIFAVDSVLPYALLYVFGGQSSFVPYIEPIQNICLIFRGTRDATHLMQEGLPLPFIVVFG